MKRHAIRWWARRLPDGGLQLYCTQCDRAISHKAFLTRDGSVVSFDIHVGRQAA